MPLYSYLDRKRRPLMVPMLGPDPVVPEYLWFDGERHYVHYRGSLPVQDPVLDVRTHDLSNEPELRALLEDAAEPVLRARTERARAYPPLGDQFDALLKEFQQRRQRGDTLTAELDTLIDRWLQIKARYPKPDLTG